MPPRVQERVENNVIVVCLDMKLGPIKVYSRTVKTRWPSRPCTTGLMAERVIPHTAAHSRFQIADP